MNPYDILELQPGAQPDEIKAAYHRLAKQWHPDRFPPGPKKAEAEARFRQLSEAFAMLKDVGRRAEVEEEVARASTVPAPNPAMGAEPTPAKDPRTKEPQDWYADALVAREEHDLDRALGLIQYAIRLDPRRPEFHMLLADVLDSRGGDKRQIVKALETVLQYAPKDVDAMVRLCEVFRSLGMSARADGLLDRARAIQPKHKGLKAALAAKPATPPAESQVRPEAGGSLSSLLNRLKASMGLFSKRN